ncbi:MAG: FecR domain-containing protein, partial [Lachnospiraceae bacterium]|nr:FecR domain-containing protein [Lachnospiraceae bacterium]
MKNAKIWIILGAVVLVAAIAIVLVIVFTQPKKTESYRTIQIYDSEGSVTVDRENVGNLRAYANMRLQSGDVLTVGTDSHAYLKLDSDKYILAEEETVIEIIAEGTPEASRTTINLVQGAIVNRIDTVLNENSSYEVNASNSTMAIRGTLVRVSLKAKVEAPAQKEVSVSVFEGAVETGIKDASVNTTDGTARTVNAGV